MKRIAVLLFSTIALFFITTQPVVAHVLKTDGSIGAILHIRPDDNPKSGTPTSYELAFKDTKNRFSLSNCNCTATISQNDKVLDSSLLNRTSTLISNNTYTFQSPGVYTLIVAGQPIHATDFAPFSLRYIMRVEAEQGSKDLGSFPLTLLIGLALMIGLIVLAAYTMDMDEIDVNHKKE